MSTSGDASQFVADGPASVEGLEIHPVQFLQQRLQSPGNPGSVWRHEADLHTARRLVVVQVPWLPE